MLLTAGIVSRIPKEVSVDRRETITRLSPGTHLHKKAVGRTKEGMTSESAASWKPWVGMRRTLKKGKC